MKPLIYAIEDDPALQELYTFTLENDFDCLCFGDSSELARALDARLPDLMLLDIMLPGDDGFTILSRLKENEATAGIPVILVSAKNEELSKVKGLNMGADDYISKPFGVLELTARIRANLRKRSPASPEKLEYKDIVIDYAKHRILVGENVLKTTRKEYNLLSLLCENAENVQERDVIFAKVWGDSFIGETRTLDIHIKEIRKKLKDAGSCAVIETLRGVGYMLT